MYLFLSLHRAHLYQNASLQIFGIFNLIAYAIGSFYLYRDWKDSHPHSSFSGSVLKRNP